MTVYVKIEVENQQIWITDDMRIKKKEERKKNLDKF